MIISPLETLLNEIREVLEGGFDGDDCETDVAAEIHEGLLIAIEEGYREGYEQGKLWGYVEGFQDGWDEGEGCRDET